MFSNICKRLNISKEVLNQYQCEYIVEELRVTINVILKILSSLPPSNLEELIGRDLYRVVLRVKDLVETCCSQEWWLVVLFLMDNEATFVDILIDLKCCFDAISLIDDTNETHGIVGQNLDFELKIKKKMEEDQKKMREKFDRFVSKRNRKWRFIKRSNRLQQKLVEQLIPRMHLIKTKQHDIGLPDIFQIDECSLTCVTSCGEGSFASVSKGTWLGMKCAKKTFNYRIENSNDLKTFIDTEEDFKQEVNTLARLNHPNIIKFLGHGMIMEKTKWKRFIVMELMDRNLSEMIDELSKGGNQVPFTYAEAIDVMMQVAKAMCYLHQQGIIHRDLKPENVLVSSSNVEPFGIGKCMYVKVADFGLSKVNFNPSNPSLLSKEKAGTTIYRAPEMDSIGAIQSHKADVYSFGIMCSKILSGKCPFEGIQKCELEDKVKGGLRPYMPINFIHLVSLINECWNWDARKRPEFSEICERLKKLKIDILTNTFHEVEPTYDNMVPQTNISSIVKSQGFIDYDELNKEVCISNPNALSHVVTFTLIFFSINKYLPTWT
jgi:serine/threonine protein kinase